MLYRDLTAYLVIASAPLSAVALSTAVYAQEIGTAAAVNPGRAGARGRRFAHHRHRPVDRPSRAHPDHVGRLSAAAVPRQDVDDDRSEQRPCHRRIRLRSGHEYRQARRDADEGRHALRRRTDQPRRQCPDHDAERGGRHSRRRRHLQSAGRLYRLRRRQCADRLVERDAQRRRLHADAWRQHTSVNSVCSSTRPDRRSSCALPESKAGKVAAHPLPTKASTERGPPSPDRQPGPSSARMSPALSTASANRWCRRR